MLNNEGTEFKYGVRIILDGSTGYKGGEEGAPCFVETQVVIVTSGVAGGNSITVQGKIKSNDTWTTLATIAGSTTTTVDVSTYDYIRYSLTVASGTGFLIASGFIFTSSPSVSGVATAANQATEITSLTSIDLKQTIVINVRQTLAFTGTSAQSSTFNATTKRVVLTTTQDCWFLIGSNPTAVKQTTTLSTATGVFLPAGGMTYPLFVTGGTDKVAVIYDASAGIMSIQESL